MKKILLSFCFASLIVGCSSKINTQRLSEVKSIAVVGFAVFKGTESTLQLARTYDESPEFNENLASDFYSAFTSSLSTKLNVRILTEEDITSNAYYQTLMAKYGTVSKLIIALGKSYRSTNMLTGEALFDMTAEEKARLIKELKVDNIIGVESMLYRGEKSSTGLLAALTGAGSRDVKFRVTIVEYAQYDYDSKAPIVELTNFIGDVPDESYKALGIGSDTFDLLKPDRKVLIAAVSSVAEGIAEKMIKH
jgi:hypothetical protein